MINHTLIEQFSVNGLVVVPNVLDEGKPSLLKQELIAGIEIQNNRYPDAFDRGMLHNCMLYGHEMAQLLGHPIMHAYLSEILSPTCILYAYQSSSLLPGSGNYGSRIHVDSPRFIDNYTTNVGVIFPVDDFTLENGATHYLMGSHRSENVPDEEAFFENASRGVCKKGDMILFNARLFHAAGTNQTEHPRHSLTLNVCRSYMRQRFDFPKMVSDDLLSSLNEDGKRFLGMNVRVPESLDQFYLPEDQRLYKANQG